MTTDFVPIRRALVSVSDKRGLDELVAALARCGATLLASGGTRSAIAATGVAVEDVAEFTGQPEILGGRVKTLHPRLHAAILARREIPADLAVLAEMGVPPIDLVVVNLYPFERTIATPGVSFAEAIEQIDIGGPSLIRGAAKNHASVAVVTSPDQYPELISLLEESGGTPLAYRLELAAEVFRLSAGYDAAISAYFDRSLNRAAEAETPFPKRLAAEFTLKTPLRYGENPHQRGAFYQAQGAREGIAAAQVLHGKELSYNNILDLDNALTLVRAFSVPAAVILKHNNPCGAAIAESLAQAFESAYEGDPISAFGGIVGLNRAIDRETAERLVVPGRFIEAIIAPGYDPEAFAILTTVPSWKKSVRLLATGAPIGPQSPPPSGFDMRRVEGGLLVQDWDLLESNPAEGEVATERAPTADERSDLDFAWRVCRSVRSNAIVVAKAGQIVGVGAGQMSRLDSVRIAVAKAGPKAQGAVLASDAFFPFRDGPDAAAAAGVTAIIQPGGSKRDDETIRACDEHKIAMVLTGRRHFRH